MLEIVMRLEEGITREEFDKNATDAPNIAWIAPSQIKYDFWCSVVPRRNNRGVVFIVKRCRSKVNKSNLGIE